MTALDFPSVRYVYEGLARRLGARIRLVPASPDGSGVDLEQLLAAIDERTRLVAISHVLFRSAWVLDVAAVCRRAREVGALVSLDAYHSVGVLPVDVRAIGADWLAGGVLKWLCGGPGGCFLYANPETVGSLAPALTGWQGHAEPFAFADAMAHAAGAWRWLGGTPVVPALYAAVAGPRILREAGIDAIRAKSMRQTQRLVDLADARGWTVNAPRDPERRGGTVAIDVPNAYPVSQALLARDILVDYRPGAGIRMAPHFYTTDAELDAAIAAIEEILESGEWKKFGERSSVVT
jgi:kynureninase